MELRVRRHRDTADAVWSIEGADGEGRKGVRRSTLKLFHIRTNCRHSASFYVFVFEFDFWAQAVLPLPALGVLVLLVHTTIPGFFLGLVSKKTTDLGIVFRVVIVNEMPIIEARS